MKRAKHFILWLLNLFNLTVQITASLSYRQQSCLWVNISLQAPSARHSVGIWSAKQCGNPTLQLVYTRLSCSLFPLSILIMEEVTLLRFLCNYAAPPHPLSARPHWVEKRQFANPDQWACKYLWAFIFLASSLSVSNILLLITKTN